MEVTLHPEKSRVQREVSHGGFRLRLKGRAFLHDEYKAFYAVHEGHVTRLEDDESMVLQTPDIYAIHPDAETGRLNIDGMGYLTLTVDGTDTVPEFVLHALLIAGAVEIRP